MTTSREYRKHAKALLRAELGVSRRTSPSKKKYCALVKSLAINLEQLNKLKGVK